MCLRLAAADPRCRCAPASHLLPALLRTPRLPHTCTTCSSPRRCRPVPTLQVYAPCRTVVVYAPAEFTDAQADSLSTGVPGLAVKDLGPYYSY